MEVDTGAEERLDNYYDGVEYEYTDNNEDSDKEQGEPSSTITNHKMESKDA